MTNCIICIDEFKQPVSLPCGHVFCTECIVKTVQAAQSVQPLRSLHPCPTCRASYNIAPMNPALVPPYLRPYITPSIRRVYIDPPSKENDQASCSQNVNDELTRLRAENRTLRTHCVLWRRRAELHGAATLGLLDFARMVRDQAVNLARERDELQKQCSSLKRKLVDVDQLSEPCTKALTPSTSNFTFSCHPRGSPSVSDPSRLTVPTLLDLKSCINQTSTSLRHNLDLCSRTNNEEPGPSDPPTASTSGVPIQSSSDLEPPKKRRRQDASRLDARSALV